MLPLIKHIYIINGTMGVGKTTVGKALSKQLDNSVFLDGDNLWNMHPFIVNDETKEMIMNNITYCLNSFIHTSTIHNIIFVWVIPDKDILDTIQSRLDLNNCIVHPITLICSKEKLIERIQKDIEDNIRDQSVIERSLSYIDNYNHMETHHIDVSNKSIEIIVKEIKDSVY